MVFVGNKAKEITFSWQKTAVLSTMSKENVHGKFNTSEGATQWRIKQHRKIRKQNNLNVNLMPKFKEILATIKKHLPNKYWTILLVFGLYITFFDANSLLKRYKTTRQIRAVEQEIKQYDQRIAADQEEIQALESNLENLERFAREQYHMKKLNEDIFIIRE